MSEILDRLKSGDFPEHARNAVVQGIMPLETEELLEAIYLICSDAPEFVEDAMETFAGFSEPLIKGFFEDRDRDGKLIEFYLTRFPLKLPIRSACILNPNTPGTAIEAIAPSLEVQLLDLAVNNQVKILERPEIIEALQKNPGLTINQKQKLEEYGRLLLKDAVSPAEELEGKSLKEIEEEAIKDAKDFVKTFGKEEMKPVTGKTSTKTAPAKAAPTVEEPAQDDKEKVSVLEQLANMSIPQKIQAAIKGDREVRSILVRESNKQVCCAVIKSPKITEAEIEFIANLRNVQSDVLRLVAANRDWTKSYKVILNLVKNPRTPINDSLRLLPRLNKKDLKNLVKDRGIPQALRTMAKRISRAGSK